MKALRCLLTVVLMVCLADAARGDVKLPAIFGDHMVVQRGMRVPIWGWADAGETVTVRAGGQEHQATAHGDGRWRVTLEPIDSRVPVEITVSGKNQIVIRDVLVGEVWLASGQSNMAWPLKSTDNAEQAIAAADRPQIRLFTVENAHAEQPLHDLKGKWEICTPESAADFSAVAYYFGLDLQEKLSTPVGLINSSWGGTRAEAWMPRERVEGLNLPYEPAWTQQFLNPPVVGDAIQPPRKRPEQGPGALYNAMISPLAGLAMRGVIWYQGETNTIYPQEYRKVLGELITSWRQAWGQGDFPFLVVQLANFEPKEREWAPLRWSQAQVAKDLPNVGVVVTIDVGDPKDIHPTDKQTVGRRLARSAERIAYERTTPHSGPVFKSMQVRDDEVVVRFEHVFGGLQAKNDQLKGFEVAGEDGKFAAADARIEGDTVVLRAQGVKNPREVRYAWANNPAATLYNAADLPAVPFKATMEK